MEEQIRRLFTLIKQLTERVIEVETEHGETTEITFETAFPPTPYNNQIVVRVDLSPPEGGQMYRYDTTRGTWLRLN